MMFAGFFAFFGSFWICAIRISFSFSIASAGTVDLSNRAGVERRDLHRNVLAALAEHLGRDVLRLKANQNADSAAAVHVSDAVALVADETADLDVLADR